MADTPKSAFPTISDQATVRIKLGLLVSIIVAIVGGTVWLTNMHNDTARMEQAIIEMRDWVRSLDHRMANVEEAVGVPRSAMVGPPTPKEPNP